MPTSAPFHLHCDPQTRALRVRFEPGDPAPDDGPPDRAGLQQALADAGLGDALLDEDAILDFLRRCADAAAGKEDTAGAEPVDGVIGRCEDAKVRVTLSADRLRAWLDLEPPLGGAAASLAQLQRALSEQGVVFGVRDDALQEALQRGHCAQWLVAEGREPEDGVPAHFDCLLRRGARSTGDDAVFIDYREQGALVVVDPGTPLMRRTPAKAGRAGRDLLGQTVPPRAPPDPPFDPSQGAAPATHDPNLLVAEVAGLPSVGPRSVSVNPHVEVDAVNLQTGNIRFDGSVRVKGDVRAGMTVRVSGDVYVDGTVEAAEIVAGGHLVVGGGIIGRAEHGRDAATARVRCQGDVQARFIEHADIEAGGQLRAEAGLRDSQVLAGDAVLIGGNGSIVGGRTAAHRRVVVPVLGSAWSDPTEVQVGVNPFIDAKLDDLRQRREQRDAERAKLQQLLNFLEQQPAAANAQPGLRDKAEATLQACDAALAAMSVESADLAAQLALSDAATIEVQRRLHGGVQLMLGPVVHRVKEDRGPCRVRRVDGQIDFG